MGLFAVVWAACAEQSATLEVASNEEVQRVYTPSDLVLPGPSGVGTTLSTLDADGDGWDDLLIGGHYATGTAELHYGGPNGLSAVSSWSSGTFPYTFDAAAGVGDLDGDGDDEIAAFGWEVGPNRWLVALWEGSPTGPRANPVRVLSGPGFENNFDGALARAGDVNGDGYDDLLLGQMSRDGAQNWEGVVELYYGGPNGIGAVPAWSEYGGGYQAYLGQKVAGVGDVNGDGYADFTAEGAFFNGGLPGTSGYQVLLWLGGPNGPGAYSRVWPGGGSGAAGDLDGDGFDDVVLTEQGTLQWYRGQPAGAAAAPASSLFGVGWGQALGASDVGGDGLLDVIVGDPTGFSGAGTGHVVYGGAGGPMFDAALVAGNGAGPFSLDDCGHAVSAGDWNGDGFGDVAVGCPLGESRVEVRYGGTDADGDGDPGSSDCDDGDPTRFHGAVDVWYDGIDTDCRGNDDFDRDGDGQAYASYGGTDCDDSSTAYRGCVALAGTCPGPMTLEASGLTSGGAVCLVLGRETQNGGNLAANNPCEPGTRPYTNLGRDHAVRAGTAGGAGTVALAGTLNGACDDSVQVLDLVSGTRTPVVAVP